MSGIDYETLKTIVNMCNMPSAILAVEKNTDGTCGKILMAATNDKFSMTGEDVEGQPYDLKIPRDPKFEEILFKAAWNNEHYHAYVDTTRLYGFWTEDIVIPINNNGDSKIGYCQFIYNLSKEMDSGIVGCSVGHDLFYGVQKRKRLSVFAFLPGCPAVQ